MSTVDRFRAAVESQDLSVLPEIFAPDVKFFSPVKFTPFEGIAAVQGLFEVLMKTFEDFHYVGELAGDAEIGTDGASAPSHILIFRATAGGKAIHGVDLLQLDADGLIKEFTVMVRPLSAMMALGQAVQAGLDAAAAG